MVGYVKVLNSLRKEIAEKQPEEETTSSAPQSNGLVPSVARQSAMAQTQEQAQMRYEPIKFVKRGIEQIRAARQTLKSQMDSQREAASAKSRRTHEKAGAAIGNAVGKVITPKNASNEEYTSGLIARPNRNVPDGPKGQETYVTNSESGSLFGLIDKTEGGGNYSTLFGHSQREGGQFAGVDVSNMTIDQAVEFASPSGKYGQWVAGKVGRVSTPMGRHQIVGSTLRAAAAEMGLSGDTKFSPEVQNQIAVHLARRRLAGAKTMAEKRSALRLEWEGFKNVSDSDLNDAIYRFENNESSDTVGRKGK